MKNLIQRSLTGIIYVILIASAVIAGGWWFELLFSLFALLAIHEFVRLSNASTGGESMVAMILDMFSGLFLFLTLSTACNIELMPGSVIPLHIISLILFLLCLIARLVSQLYSRHSSPLTNLAYSYMSLLYIALPLGLMSAFYTFLGGPALLLAMFIMIWLSDTGAFLIGSMIGKHKLFPRISPGKTWEGFFGGIIFVIASAFVMKYCFQTYYESISIAGLCGMGVTVAIFATWGDLVESLIKRTLGVKDSGNILPGHGGILDRIDSMLLVSPAAVLYLTVLYILP